MAVDNISKKPVIGILGGIASGKSSVASEFAKLGCQVIDADDALTVQEVATGWDAVLASPMKRLSLDPGSAEGAR